MKYFGKVFSLAPAFAVMCALFPAAAHAQRWVYVNDNNGNPNLNTVTGFLNVPAATLARPFVGEPAAGWPTGGTGLVNYYAAKNQAIWKLGTPPGKACLFVSDPAPSAGFPAGDIAVFTVNTVTGVLVPAAPPRYASPGANNGTTAGIQLAAGAKTLYAAYTTSNTIVVWKVTWNGTNCLLKFGTQIAAVGLHGGSVDGMSESHNYSTLVVAYADGSVQSFSTPGYGIAAAPCAGPIITTGFTDGNGGVAAGVDITANSGFAIFGDASAVTELEISPLPITCATLTTDYGGTIVASATNLGPGVSSNNVWLSPNGLFIYVANNSSGQITTATFAQPVVTGQAGVFPNPPCTPLHTNPTALRAATWAFDAGIQTSLTVGTGTRLYVAEYGNPSSVALLKVDAAGCTEEFALSPFVDPNSNFTPNGFGAIALNAWPLRPF